MSAESPQPDFENTYSGSKNNESATDGGSSVGTGRLLSRRTVAGALAGGVAGLVGGSFIARAAEGRQMPVDVEADAATRAAQVAADAMQNQTGESITGVETTAELTQEDKFEFVKERVNQVPDTDVQWIHDQEAPGQPRDELAPQELDLRYELDGNGFVQVVYDDPTGKYQADGFVFFLTGEGRTSNQGIWVKAPGGRLDLSLDPELQTLYRNGVYQGDSVRAVASPALVGYTGPCKLVDLATSDPAISDPDKVFQVDVNVLRGTPRPSTTVEAATQTPTPTSTIEPPPVVGRFPEGEGFGDSQLNGSGQGSASGMVEMGTTATGAVVGGSIAKLTERLSPGWQAKPEQYISKSDGQDVYSGGDKVAVGLMESGQQEITNDEQQPEFKQEVSPMRAAAIEIKHAAPTSVENEQAEGVDSPIGPIEDLPGLQDLVAQYNAERAPLQSQTDTGVRMSPEPSTPEVRRPERDPNWPEPEVMDPKYQA